MPIEIPSSSDPKARIQSVEGHITDLKNLCHQETRQISDPKAKALLETAADVLDGLEKAFSDYQSENEEAWVRNPDRPSLQ